MNKSQLRKRAEDSLRSGRTKHETYEELKMMTSTKPEEIAKIVQGVPTEKVKDTNKILQILLLIFIGIYVVLHIFVVYVSFQYETYSALFWPVFRFIAGLIIFFALMFYRSEAYRFVLFWMGLGLLRSVLTLFTSGFDWVHLVDIFLYLIIVVLAFLLERKLFPAYQVVKELYQNRLGEDRLRNTIRFED